ILYTTHTNYIFFLKILHTPISTLFPYTTLFRSSNRRTFSKIFAGRSKAKQRRKALPVRILSWRQSSCQMSFQTIWSLAYPRKDRSEEHTSELQSRRDLVCRLLLEKKKKKLKNRF